MTEIVVALIGFGAGIALEFFRTRGRIDELERSLDRKDHEHRSAYCHQLLSASADLIATAKEDPGPEPQEPATPEQRGQWVDDFEDWDREWTRRRAAYDGALNALETFGTNAEMDAARGFLAELESGETTAERLTVAREQIVKAVRADVAPD